MCVVWENNFCQNRGNRAHVNGGKRSFPGSPLIKRDLISYTREFPFLPLSFVLCSSLPPLSLSCRCLNTIHHPCVLFLIIALSQLAVYTFILLENHPTSPLPPIVNLYSPGFFLTQNKYLPNEWSFALPTDSKLYLDAVHTVRKWFKFPRFVLHKDYRYRYMLNK